MSTIRSKVLFLNIHMHHKNGHSISKYSNIDFQYIHHPNEINNYNLSEFDCVYSPAIPIDVSLYPNTRFIFGPHFSVLPDEKLLFIKSPRSSFIILSEWIKNLWKRFPICNNLHLVDIPFGVDTSRFSPTLPFKERSTVFIYFKGRDPADLAFIQRALDVLGISYRVFGYSNRYDESEYLRYLQESKYGIWVDAHESQGFALQEALSCDVPLFVWNISSFNQEYGSNYPDVPATTVPYWDDRCGECFYYKDDFSHRFEQFLRNIVIEKFKPREYIMENLSMEVCEKRFIHLITTNTLLDA